MGDEVFVKNPNPGKLEPLFEGPYEIVKGKDNNVFELADGFGNKLSRTVNTPQLKGPTKVEKPDNTQEAEFILKHRGFPGNFDYLIKVKGKTWKQSEWFNQSQIPNKSLIAEYWKKRRGEDVDQHLLYT